MAIYTKLLGHCVAGAGHYAIPFSTPLGVTTELRDIVIVQFSGSPQIAQVYFETPGGDQYWLVAVPDLESGRALHIDMRQVITPGSDVTCYSPYAGTMFSLTGYQFSS